MLYQHIIQVLTSHSNNLKSIIIEVSETGRYQSRTFVMFGYQLLLWPQRLPHREQSLSQFQRLVATSYYHKCTSSL